MPLSVRDAAVCMPVGGLTSPTLSALSQQLASMHSHTHTQSISPAPMITHAGNAHTAATGKENVFNFNAHPHSGSSLDKAAAAAVPATAAAPVSAFQPAVAANLTLHSNSNNPLPPPVAFVSKVAAPAGVVVAPIPSVPRASVALPLPPSATPSVLPCVTLPAPLPFSSSDDDDDDTVSPRKGSAALLIPSPCSSTSSASTSSGSGAHTGGLLTSNVNLSNSYRKDNGKRCLTRAPLTDILGNNIPDYPHQRKESLTTLTHEPAVEDMAAAAASSASCVGPPPSVRPMRKSGLNGMSALGGVRLGMHGAAVPLPHPILTLPSTHQRTPEQATPTSSSEGAGGNGGLFGADSTVLRTPTPSSSPARQQLMFDSADKHAPSSASSAGSASLNSSARRLGAASGSAFHGAAGSNNMNYSPLPSLESPVVVRRRNGGSNGEAAGGLLSGQRQLGLSAQRNGGLCLGTPARHAPDSGASTASNSSSDNNGHLSVRQQAMLASPALTIESAEAGGARPFQIRALKGLVMPADLSMSRRAVRTSGGAGAGSGAPRHPASGLASAGSALAASLMSDAHHDEEEAEMARNRAAAAAAAAAATSAAADVTHVVTPHSDMPEIPSTCADEDASDDADLLASQAAVAAAVAAHEAECTTAEVERHRPKRARSLAFTSVPIQLPLGHGLGLHIRSGSVQPLSSRSGADSTGVSPLFQSSSFADGFAAMSSSSSSSSSTSTNNSRLASHRSNPSSTTPLTLDSTSASSPSPLSFGLSVSGRHSMPLLSRTLSCTSLAALQQEDDDSPVAMADEATMADTPPSLSPSTSGGQTRSDATEYHRQLLLSSAMAAEDSLLRTLAEASSGSSAAPSITRWSASASPRCFASESPPPMALETEACATDAPPSTEGVLVASSSSSSSSSSFSAMGYESSVFASLRQFVPPAPLRILEEDEEDMIPSGLATAPVHGCSFAHQARSMSTSASIPAAPLSLGSALALHRRGSTSMLGMHDAPHSMSTSATAAGVSDSDAQQALMDETEDDAADCASSFDAAAPSLPRSLGAAHSDASFASDSTTAGDVLPGIPGLNSDVKRISGATMERLLKGEFRSRAAGGHLTNGLDNFIIIDCRYDYEYSGGHSQEHSSEAHMWVDGAINLNDRALLSKFFRVNSGVGSRLAVVFHCEFSQNRAPKSYRFFRSLDRLRNSAAYPLLSFPEIAVLEGGYKSFFHHFPQHCHPRAYVSMWDEAFQEECRTETSKHRRSWHTSKVVGQGAAGVQAAAAGGHASKRTSRRRGTAQSSGGAALQRLPDAAPLFPFMRAVSSIEPSAAGVSAADAAASLSPAAAAAGTSTATPPSLACPRQFGGIGSMFSPMAALTPGSAAGVCGGAGTGLSPLPSFSLGTSPAADARPRSSASAALAATTPSHQSGSSLAGAAVSPLAPLAFHLSISSPNSK